MAAASDAAARSLESRGFSELLKLDDLRPPEMLLETARRRNSDTEGWGKERSAQDAARGEASADKDAQTDIDIYFFFLSWLTGSKMHTPKKLQEIKVDSIL